MRFPVFSLVLLGSACAECEPWALRAAQQSLGQGADDQPLSQAQTAQLMTQLMTQQMLLVRQQP